MRASCCSRRVTRPNGSHIGGTAGFVALAAHLLDGGADLVGIRQGERDLLPVNRYGVALHLGSDFAVSFGGDAGELREAEVSFAEFLRLADEGVGVLATHSHY